MLWKILTVAFVVLAAHLGVILLLRPSCETRLADDDRVRHIMEGSGDGRVKLIIDTDPGGDDAVALMLALAAKDRVRVLAFTAVYGNTGLGNVEINLLKLLTVANRTDVPVYRGVPKPLVQNYTPGSYFGKDGFGDSQFNQSIEAEIDDTKHAAIAMIELVRAYPGQISILTLGPLTNVALAASLDPSFTRKVKRFYVMGSTIGDPERAPEIEFNFGLDPESDAIFLDSTTIALSSVMPWDVALKYNISKEWRTQVLGTLDSEAMKFLNKVERVGLSRQNEWLPVDAMALASVLWPELVTTSLKTHMSAITYHPFKGAVSIDPNSTTKNVAIARSFDVNGFKDKLLQYLAR